MTDHATLANTIIRAIRADGFCVTCINYLAVDGGAVKLTAWRSDLGPIRPADGEVWTAKAPDRYRAAVALAEVLGWALDE